MYEAQFPASGYHFGARLGYKTAQKSTENAQKNPIYFSHIRRWFRPRGPLCCDRSTARLTNRRIVGFSRQQSVCVEGEYGRTYAASWTYPKPLGRPSADLDNSAHRFGRCDGRKGKRRRPRGDCRDCPVGAYKQNIERKWRILHPERCHDRSPEVEQHAAVCRKMPPPHQTSLPRSVIGRNFDPEGAKTLRSFECDTGEGRAGLAP